MKPVHIIAARRSPIGRFGGGLKSLTAADLAHAVADAMLPRELRALVRQVIIGQVLQAGSGMNVARQLGLKLGLPQETPAFTVNMACGSSLKAVALGADAIASNLDDATGISTSSTARQQKGSKAMKIRPLNDRVVVKRHEEETKTKGGIIIPDSAKEKPLEGTVVAIGSGKVLKNGKSLPLDVKVGDKVLFGKYSGTEVKLDGEEHTLLREDDILAVLDK